MNKETSRFIYTIENIKNLKKSLSPERLGRYETAVNFDTESALKLYIWNSEISAAFYTPLQGLEVCLRNALHYQLSHKYQQTNWFDIAPLHGSALKKLDEAKASVANKHGLVHAPHVVAELSFGFWLSLLSRKYHGTLWVPALHKAFPYARLKPSQIHSTLDHLRVFRNRIAHHEPIFHRHLASDYNSILKVLRWMCSDTAHWIEQNNSVQTILQRRLYPVLDIPVAETGEAQPSTTR